MGTLADVRHQRAYQLPVCTILCKDEGRISQKSIKKFGTINKTSYLCKNKREK
jgi:hypothetical protein